MPKLVRFPERNSDYFTIAVGPTTKSQNVQKLWR